MPFIACCRYRTTGFIFPIVKPLWAMDIQCVCHIHSCFIGPPFKWNSQENIGTISCFDIVAVCTTVDALKLPSLTVAIAGEQNTNDLWMALLYYCNSRSILEWRKMLAEALFSRYQGNTHFFHAWNVPWVWRLAGWFWANNFLSLLNWEPEKLYLQPILDYIGRLQSRTLNEETLSSGINHLGHTIF